jgi:biopolymer transport protein TolR
MKSFRERSRFPELDLTPLIDILFMLIIFFVLAASFDRGAVTVELPRGGTAEVSETRPLVITVTKEGHFLLDDGATASPEETLAAAAAAAAAGRPVSIAGDVAAPWGTVAELLDLLRSGGVTSVGLLFTERGVP